METFGAQEAAYKGRIERFMVYLKKNNPQWISQRDWFKDLHKFDLGENFFNKVLLADSLHSEDKRVFYEQEVIKSKEQIAKKTRSKHEDIECGFMIELDIQIEDTKEEHEILLGYIWWKSIYNQGKNKGEFNTIQIVELEKKLSKFQQTINRMDAL